MAKLCQIIAAVGGKKTATQKVVTKCHHLLQKSTLLDGISRTYKSKDEDGDQLPSEHKRVQVATTDVVKEAFKAWTTLFDVVATQDTANCEAKANVVVGGKVILENVPVTHLLFLAKQLTDIHTFIEKLPVLDASAEWAYDANSGCYKAKTYQQSRTKKVPKVITLAAPTKEHPAQVQLVNEDVIAGTWDITHMSGAIPEDARREMLDKVAQLQEAVQFAREEANGTVVVDAEVGKSIFDFIGLPIPK